MYHNVTSKYDNIKKNTKENDITSMYKHSYDLFN